MSIKIMNQVWENSKSKGSQLLLLLAIADHADEHGIAWPGITTLAEKIRMSERQVKRLRQNLVESGELVILREGGGRGNTDLVQVTVKGDKESPKKAQENGDNLSERVTKKGDKLSKGDKLTIEKVTNCQEKGDIAMSPEPSVEPSIEPSVSKEPSAEPADLLPADAYPLFVDAYERIWGTLPESEYRFELIADWAERVTTEGWEYALKECADRRKVGQWRYLEKILARVEVEGIGEKPDVPGQIQVVGSTGVFAMLDRDP